MVEAAAGNGIAVGGRVGHNSPPVLEVTNLKKHFPVKKGVLRRTVGQVYAVDDVTFQIGEGETLGMVGESGCRALLAEAAQEADLRSLGCVNYARSQRRSATPTAR